MTAFRAVREDDDVYVVEGLGIPFGGPFGGRDSYATFASARTDFGWDLFPDRTPADPEDVAPQYVRPLRFHHGFDNDVPGVRLGGWSPVRMDDDGVWVQAQLDKRNAYYSKVRALLDKNGAGLSAGTIDYNMRYDNRTGEWLDWPVWELSITPTESNPYARIAARSAEVITILAGRADMSTKDINDLPDSDFAYIEPGGEKDAEGKTTPRSKRHFPVHDAAHVRNALARAPQSPFGEKAMPKIKEAAKKFGVDQDESSRSAVRSGPACDAAQGAGIIASIYYLADLEADEPAQYAQLLQAASLIQDWMNAEVREPVSDDDAMRAFRAGKRNSSSDQAHIDAIHQHAVALGASAHTDETPAEEDGEDAARSGETQTTLRIVEREDPAAVRASLLELAATVGSDAARRLIG